MSPVYNYAHVLVPALRRATSVITHNRHACLASRNKDAVDPSNIATAITHNAGLGGADD